MDDAIRGFLHRARQNAWVSGKGRVETDDGSEAYKFQEDGWGYLDRFFGGRAFIGNEIVQLNGQAVWGLNYYGYIIDAETDEKEAYAFLKEAMRAASEEDTPMRGPDEFTRDRWTYRWLVTALTEREHFTFFEEILFNGQRVYYGFCHGGPLPP